MMDVKIRQLVTDDIFDLSRICAIIIKKVKKSINVDIGGMTDREAGMEMILNAAENLHLAKDEVKELLANITGLTVDEVAKLPVEQTFELINEIKKIPYILDFFK